MCRDPTQLPAKRYHQFPCVAAAGKQWRATGRDCLWFPMSSSQSQLLLRVRHGVDQYFAAMPPRGCSVHADRRTFCWSTARCPLCCLTFEVTGRRRQDAKPGPVKMYRVPPAWAWGPAVGAPVDRGVRPRCIPGERLQVRNILGDGSYRVCLADTASAPKRSGFVFSVFRNWADATKLWHSVRSGNFVSVIVRSSSRPWATAL